MNESRQERHTAQFYEWEQRGRGWLLCDDAVELEPPFHPFIAHRAPLPYIDDGHRETFLSSLAGMFKKKHVVRDMPAPEVPPIEPVIVEAQEYHTVGISFQRSATIKAERMEQVFVMLSQYPGKYAFEIIADHARIVIQLSCPVHIEDVVQGILQAYFPEAILHHHDVLNLGATAAYITDFGLEEEFMRPLAAPPSGDADPYIGIFTILNGLQSGEQVIIQCLFERTTNPWAESIMRAVTINGKESFFIDDPDMPTLAQEKVSRPLIAASVRLLAGADTLERADTLLRLTAMQLIHSCASKHNRLVPLSNDGYGFEDRLIDMFNRESHRLGMLLNVRELVTIAHFPNYSIRAPKLLYATVNTKAPPHTTGTYRIGINIHQGTTQPVYLPDENRFEHIHIIGKSGSGKSTLLTSLICKDIAGGEGIAVLDPHGDLIEGILPHIPKSRINDVVLIDPSDAAFPVAFNLLRAHSDLEKELLASDLVALFRRFSTSWGDQMNSVFANAILAILESSTGGTLIELRRFLIEKPFRDEFLKTVQDPAIIYYWQHEYPLLKSSSLGSILTRLDTFLRPKLIRHMVSQPQSLDMEQLMDSGKIILVKLSQGLIGEENSYLLGASIVAKIQQAAMARQAKAQSARKPFFLYIDEFHHFLTPSMSMILTGARKYRLGLIVAHQDMQQVSKHDTELASAIIGNAGTRICFRLGEVDAKKFAEGFSSFTAEDILNLERGDAIMRIGRAEHDCNVRVVPVQPNTAYNLQEHIIAASRNTYAVALQEPTKATEDIQYTPVESKPVLEAIPQTQPAHNPEPVKEVSTGDQEKIKEQHAARIEQKQHRYWQNLIKKMAEERGYKASIEFPVLNGKGQVDVSLERDGKKIACEISVSTKPEWELHNIKKCLEAGYDTVIACSSNKTTLQKLQQHVLSECTSNEQQKIVVTEPDQVWTYLDARLAEPQQKEEVIKGYRVKVSYAQVSSEQKDQKHQSLTRIVRDALLKS